MLSFFYKKKTNSDVSPEEVIQGPATAGDPQTQNNGGADEFIFVERKTTTPTPDNNPNAMYRGVGQGHGALPYPQTLYPPIGGGGGSGGVSGKVNNSLYTPTSYLQDVPFELSLRLATKNISDLMQMQVDGILAFMTRQMSVDESVLDEYSYSFALEHSIMDENC